MLLRIILEPMAYFGRENASYSTLDGSSSYVLVDIMQFIQENLLELAANPYYISHEEIIQSMKCIEELLFSNKKPNSCRSLQRVYSHFLKMLFMVNLMILRKESLEAPNKLFRILPIISPVVVESLNKFTEKCENGKIRWNLIENPNDFVTFLRDCETTNSSWIYTVFGTVFQEFPKSVNLLSSGLIYNTVTRPFEDKYLMALAQAIYLNHTEGLCYAFTDDCLKEDVEKRGDLIGYDY